MTLKLKPMFMKTLLLSHTFMRNPQLQLLLQWSSHICCIPTHLQSSCSFSPCSLQGGLSSSNLCHCCSILRGSRQDRMYQQRWIRRSLCPIESDFLDKEYKDRRSTYPDIS